VYHGKHLFTEEKVAIKVMTPNYIKRADEAHRAFKEA